eukprot:scaffold20.g7742.t1
MLWLLGWLGYAALASAVAGAAGWAAVQRFSIVQRVLQTVVERALRAVAECGDTGYRIERTETGEEQAQVVPTRMRWRVQAHRDRQGPLDAAWRSRPPASHLYDFLPARPTGIVVTNLRVAAHILEVVQVAGNQATEAAVAWLEVGLPSLSRPVALRARGVALALQQAQLPPPLGAEAQAAAQARRREEDKASKLAVVEELLWGAGAGPRPVRRSRWNPTGAYLERLQARAVKKLIAFTVQLVKVEISDVALQYTQYGEPGPRPAAGYLQGADGALLRLRSLTLLPQGTPAAAAPAAGAGPPPPPAPPDGAQPAPGAAAAAEAAVRMAAEEAPWWQAVLQVPQLLWSHVVTDSPSAAKLGVSGVSLVLLTYPTSWQGYHAAKAAAARAQQPQAFSFTRGAFAAAVGSAAAGPGGAGARKRRRPAVTVQRLPQAGAEPRDWQPPLPGALAPAPGPAEQQRQGQERQQQYAGGGSAAIDYRELLRLAPAEEQVVFRQWELAVTVCLLPPGYAAPEGAGGASLPPSPAQQPAGAPRFARAASPFSSASQAARAEPGFFAQPPPGPRHLAHELEHAAGGSTGGLEHAAGGSMLGLGEEGEDSLLPEELEGVAPAAAHVGSGSWPVYLRPVLDRGSMAPELITTVTESDRAPFSRGRRASLAGIPQQGGMPTIRENGHADGPTSPDSGAGTPPAGKQQQGQQGQPPLQERRPSRVASPANADSDAGVEEHSAGDGAVPGHAAAAASPRVTPLSRTSSVASSASTFSHGTAVLDVGVSLKALILEFSPASVAIVNRLIDRQLHFQHFGAYWEVRPQVDLHQHATCWWQHAGGLLAAECGRVARRKVALSALAQRRRRRLEYQQLYAAKHVTSPAFQEPGRRWYHVRRRVRPASAEGLERLRQLEGELSAEEVAHFRFGVAATHNARIAGDRRLSQFLADKLDALVYNRGPVSTDMQELLLHHDQRPEGGAGEPGGAGDALSEALSFGMRLALACPKLGVALDVRRVAPLSHAASAAAAAEQQAQPSPPAPDEDAEAAPDPQPPQFVILSVHGAGLEVTPGGGLALRVSDLRCGSCARATAPVDTAILASPSTVCHRVCKAAEFFRYAVLGQLVSESWQAEGEATCFFELTLDPRLGHGGRTVAHAVAGINGGGAQTRQGQQGQPLPEWLPGGYDATIRIAAVGMRYEPRVFSTLLHFADSWDACKLAPWLWARPELAAAAPGAGAPQPPGAALGGSGAADPPPLPYSPEPLGEMVLSTEQLGRKAGSVSDAPLFAVKPHPSTTGLAGREDSLHLLPAAPTPSGVSQAYSAPGKEAARRSPAPAPAELPTLQYLLVVAVQNIRLSVAGENAELCLQTGAARRTDATAFLDVFSYLSSPSRRVVAQALLPARVTFDAGRRTLFTEEAQAVDVLESQLQEIELTSMAKVWAYPEDMPTIIQGIQSQEYRQQLSQNFAEHLAALHAQAVRSSAGGGGASGAATPAAGRASGADGLPSARGGALPDFLRDPQSYPMPLIPFLKCGPFRGNAVQRMSAMPDEPGAREKALAVTAMGVQAWLSPIHIWHLLSVERTVRAMVQYLLNSNLAESLAAERRGAGAGAAPVAPESEEVAALLEKRRIPKLLLSFGVQQASVLWMIGTWTPKSMQPAPGGGYRRSWGITVKRGDPAYLWAQWLAPVYSVSMANVLTTYRRSSAGTICAASSIDGVIVRDLQLPEAARHAYVLRPLPARARRLNAWLTGRRRQLLGVVPASRGRMLWVRGMQAILMRRRTSQLWCDELELAPGHTPGPFSFSGPLFGPQVRLSFASAPGTRAQPSSSEVWVEVGQLLAYVRIKQQASMTAFATQISQITQSLIPSDGGPKAPAPGGGAAARARPRRQPSLLVHVTLVGIDLLFRVQSKDLMSIKLEQGRIAVEQRAITATSGPRDVSLHLAASVKDVVIQDLRAGPEHSQVLVPSGGEPYCSLDCSYTAYVDPRRAGPSLVVQLQNPRIIVLFRFVMDVMQAVDIISSAATNTQKESARAGAEAGAAGGPGVAATAGAAADAAASVARAPEAVASAVAEAAQAQPAAAGKRPLEIAVQLRNLHVLLPISSDSRTCLGAQVEQLMVAMPGEVLPPVVLEDCELPGVGEMVKESLLSNRTFKYSGFHDGTAARGAGPCAAPAGGAAPMPPPPAPCAPAGARAAAAAAAAPLKQPVNALQALGKAVAKAAAVEGLSMRTSSSFRSARQRLGASPSRPAGVLYINEAVPQQRLAGVLEIDAAAGDDAADVRRGRVRFEGPEAAAPPSGAGANAAGAARPRPPVTVQRESPHGITVPAAGAGAAPAPRAALPGRADSPSKQRPGPASETPEPEETLLTPLEQEVEEEAAGEEGPAMPTASLAVCIERFTVSKGVMVRVPNFYHQKERGPGFVNEKQGSFIPPSLSSFSWPVEVWDLISGSVFIHPANISLVMFCHGEPAPAPQLHFSSTPLTGVFNAPHFTALMDFIGGNLGDYLHPKLPPGAEPPPPKVPPQVLFNPAMKFGPRPDQVATFRLTVAVPRLTAVFEAHPGEWTGPGAATRHVGPEEAHLVRPFFKAVACNVLFDLGRMTGGDTFMTVCATSMDVQDLRLAYRLDEVSSHAAADMMMDEAAQGQGPPGPWQPDWLAGEAHSSGEEEGWATPPSHPDSRQSTPHGGDAGAEAAAAVAWAAAAAGADGLAPPDIVGRVLSDSGAELLVDDLSQRQQEVLAQRSARAAEALGDAAPGGGGGPANPVTAAYAPRVGAAPGGAGLGPPTEHSYATPSSGHSREGSFASPRGQHGSEIIDTPSTEATFSFQPHPSLGRPPAATPGLFPGASPPDGSSDCRSAPHPHTGIRLSVARRLSEQAERRRAAGTPSTGEGGGAEAHAGTPGAAAAHVGQRSTMPVIEFESVQELAPFAEHGSSSAVLNVLSAPYYAPPTEAARTRLALLPGSNPRVKLEVSLGMLADSTMAVEVALSNALVNWPYFNDLSLIWSIANIFSAPWSPQRTDEDRPEPAGAPPPVPSAWLYFNLVLTDTQAGRARGLRRGVAGVAGFFVPVFDIVVAQSMAAQLWDIGPAAATKSDFERVADLALACMLLDGMQDEGEEGGGGRGPALALEERGLVISAAAARFSYSYGGDGESNIKARARGRAAGAVRGPHGRRVLRRDLRPAPGLGGLPAAGRPPACLILRCLRASAPPPPACPQTDLRNTAAFVRDPAARVTCAMLPLSCKLDLSVRVPRAAEQGEVERLHQAACRIQRAWRRYCALRAFRRAAAAGAPPVSEGGAAAAATLLAGLPAGGAGAAARGPRRLDSLLEAVETTAGGLAQTGGEGRPWKLVDDLVLDVADPKTRQLLLDYRRASQDRSQLMYLQRFRATASTALAVDAGALTLRAAFSHIPFWQAASAAVREVVLAPPRGTPRGSGPEAATAAPRTRPFRPSSLQVTGLVQGATVVLCNDKPETFGAPDVLQLSLAQLNLAYDMATLLPDRPPNKAARLAIKTYASFLNSSTSRWEAMYDVWPLSAEFVDIVSPLYLSDRKQNIWLTSDQHLDINFNPASLLSVGDALAFVRTLQEEGEVALSRDPSLVRRPSSGQALQEAVAAAAARRGGAPPGAALEGGAATAAVMSRAPQKYLIQNQSGMRVYYWADVLLLGQAGGTRSPVYCLENGVSENLRVVPASKRLSFVQFSHTSAGSERTGATINLHFEGNWMPLQDVAVNVVGKYRYRMTSPADSTTVPLIIDIILVGRTKIITLHSGIWVENAINRAITLRLHVPTTPLVPPSAAVAAGGGGEEGDVLLGPLRPKAGCYLPLTAVLGGLLFLRPEGFEEAARDVVRLTPDLLQLVGQQGYVSCEPGRFSDEDTPLHVALQAMPAKASGRRRMRCTRRGGAPASRFRDLARRIAPPRRRWLAPPWPLPCPPLASLPVALVSEFQAFKHMECLAPGTIQKASEPLEVTLSIQPTLVLQNALPYEMRVLLWQVNPAPPPPPQAARRSPDGDLIASPRTSAGTASDASGNFVQDVGHLNVQDTAPSAVAGLPEPSAAGAQAGFLDMLTPWGAPSSRKTFKGRYCSFVIQPGSSQDIYMDLRSNVLLHVSIEEIGMRSTRWALVSWAQRAVHRQDGSVDVQTSHRLPKEIPLRMVGVGMSLPTHPSQVGKYLGKLKDAALHLRSLHAQFHYDVRLAVNKQDMEQAVGKIRALARKLGSASSRFRLSRRGGTSARPEAGSRVPSRPGSKRARRSAGPRISAAPALNASAVELTEARQQPLGDGDAATGDQPSALVVQQRSRGHLVVERRPRPDVALEAAPATAQRPPVAAERLPAAAERQPVTAARAAGAAAAPAELASSSEGSTPKAAQAQSVAAASTVATSPASDAHLLAGVTPSASPAPGAAAGAGVAAGRLSKAKGSRFTRALRRLKLGGGKKQAATTPASGSAAPLADAAGAAARVSATDSGASASNLLGGEQRRSDVVSADGESATVGLEAVPEGSPVGHLGGGGLPLRSSETDASGAAAAAAGPVVVVAGPHKPAAALDHTRSLPPLEQEEVGRRQSAPEQGVGQAPPAFNPWRDTAVGMGASLHPGEYEIEELDEEQDEGSQGAASTEDEQEADVRSPPVMFLGVHSSRQGPEGHSGCTRITLYAPYWLNNRTGVDLFYKDRASAPGQPFLFGAALPWDYGEVFTPGTSMTETIQPDAADAGSLPGWGGSQAESAGGGALGQALLEYKLVLMNKQDDVSLGLAHVPNRQYSQGLKITTVGNKGEVLLRGPLAQPVPVHEEMLRGFAAPFSAVGQAIQGHMGQSAPTSPLRQPRDGEGPAPLEVAQAPALRAASETAGEAGGAPEQPEQPQQPQEEPLGPAGPPAGEEALPSGVSAAPRRVGQLRQEEAAAGGGGAPSHPSSPHDIPRPSPFVSGAGTPTSATAAAAAAAFSAVPRHLRRTSMTERGLIDVLSTQPGTVLEARLSEPQAAELAAALRDMQEVPVLHAERLAVAEEREEEEEEAGEEAAAAAAQAEASQAPAAEAAADAPAQPADAPPGALRSPVCHVHKPSTEVAFETMRRAGLEAGVAPAAGPSRLSQVRHASDVHTVQSSMPSHASRHGMMEMGEHTEEEVMEAVELHHHKRRQTLLRHEAKGQRLYQFAVDVAAGPPDSIFRQAYPTPSRASRRASPAWQPLSAPPPALYWRAWHTKLVTLKPKYIIENQTGMSVAVKQLGTADPSPEETSLPVNPRFARVLMPNQRAAVYWDDADLERDLVVRPQPPGEEADWHWSGGFPIPETEWYFGLRIRGRRGNPKRFINIPVNVTVGASGSVQVTLKSPHSVQTYRIENMCKDVFLYFIQLPLIVRTSDKDYVDSLGPGQVMPYAWDEIKLQNRIRVQAKVKGATHSKVQDYSLDHLGDLPMMAVPTQAGKAANMQRRLYRTLSSELPDDLKQKLVYVTVYADGPTRVLRLSDDKNVSSVEAQHVILDLAARVKQVETQLRDVNAAFARLNGLSGAHALDLYGRTTIRQETAPALIKHAHTRLPLGLSGSGAASPAPISQLASRVNSGLGPDVPRLAAALSLGHRHSTVRFDVPRAVSESPQAAAADEAVEADSGVGPALPPGPQEQPPQRQQEQQQQAAPPQPGGAGEEIEPAPGALAVDDVPGVGPAGPSRTLAHAPSGRDWGHITPSGAAAAGTRSVPRMAAAAAAKQAAVAALAAGPSGALVPANSDLRVLLPSASVQRRQARLRALADDDAVLLIGGDLSVTVVQAQGLAGSSKFTHAFARVHITEPFPTNAEETDLGKQTSVVWQSCDPVWDESLVFRDVCAASELVVELWDLGGTRTSAQTSKLADNPAEVIKSCRFLGRAEVTLSDTLAMLSGVPYGTPLWFPLMRRGAGDSVTGRLQLRFQWEITARGLLTIKLHALERVLAQRREILAALTPVGPQVVLRWKPAPAPEEERDREASRRVQGGVLGAGVSLFGVDNELGMSGVGWAIEPSKVATEVLARHAHDHNRRHLLVSVLEARGLAPRRGVVMALSSQELPEAVVSLSMPRFETYETEAAPPSLRPRVDPAEAALTVRLYDRRGSFLAHAGLHLLGEASIHCSHIKGEDPVYVWVPLTLVKHRRLAVDRGARLEEVSDLQVFLRIQWQTEVVRGASVKLEVDLAGTSLLVMGGLQDELFNFTTDAVHVVAVSTCLDMMVRACGGVWDVGGRVDGRIQKVQLDNQMVDAVQPVVLAPATQFRPTGTSRPVEGPLVTFHFVRSFAGSGGEGEGDEPYGWGGASPGGSADGSAGAHEEKQQGIKSFKDIRLTIGALDLLTDEAFLEALLSFMTSIPTADVSQDRPWREQQRRLLSAQFGPREVESLAVNAVVPAEGADTETGPLDWVVEKEARDLEVLHGQSDLSSWYFIESAEISGVRVNVTISLSSRLLSSAGRTGLQETNATGYFNRVLGASGFQLVNVANVPISLGRWMVGTDPSLRSDPTFRGRFSNGFLSQKALRNNLTRHYTREALKEAHKVLGGAGPAVASVPLTMVWAGGSVVSLLTSVSTGSTGPVAALQQVAYVPLMGMSMIVSSFSRMLAAALALVPPERAGGDDAAVQRLIRRPANAIEAALAVPKELGRGLVAASSGLLLDPVAGWQAYRAPGAALGLVKGTFGFAPRLMVGAIEGTAQALNALAMTCLGREGIVGKLQRRVRAPGAFTDETGDGLEEDGGGPRSETALNARALMAAWQRVLPEFFPDMAQDVVLDIINVRSTRVMLVTSRHIGYMHARHQGRNSTYRTKWVVPITEIQNLTGNAENLKIGITHVHRYNLWVMGVWPVQKQKGLRCASRLIYERIIAKLNRLLQQHAARGGEVVGRDAPHRFAEGGLGDLTILSGPYAPPPQPAGGACQPPRLVER